MHISGQCYCGAIKYEAEMSPEDVAICHCTDCQSFSGSAFRTVAFATEHSFRLLQGKPTVFIKTAESGNKREQTFCPTCGSPLYSRAAGQPMATEPPQQGTPARMLGIRAGTVHQRGELKPQSQYFCRSAQPWATELAGTTKFTAGAGSPIRS